MPSAAPGQPFALLITRNFPPLVGGMESVNQHLLEALSRDWRVLLCGPSGSSAFAPSAIAVGETIHKPLFRFLIGAAFRALAMSSRFKPKLVLAGSGLAAPMAWAAAKLTGARFVIYLHGLDIVAPSRIYQRCWLPFIRQSDLVLVNSSHTRRLAIEHGVSSERVQILNPGTNIPKLDDRAGIRFREIFGLSNRPVLLSVGRLTQRKGLAEFVSKALPKVVQEFPSAILVVVGEEASDALHTKAGSERDRIGAAASRAGMEANVVFVGRLTAEGLGEAYQAADAHVFPVLEQPGDVEGFGMVALESAAHGLRTVGFAVGGIPDAVDQPSSGQLVEPGDYQALAAALIACLTTAQTTSHHQSARAFASARDWRHFSARLHELLAG